MIETKPSLVTRSDPHLAQFQRLIEANAAQEPDWLLPRRKAGLARFSELGYPTTQLEDWRFTNVAPLTRLPFKPVSEAASDISAVSLGQLTFGSLPGHRLVFIDGHFFPALSSVCPLAPAVTVTNLADAVVSAPGLVEKHLGSLVRLQDNAFAALNSAFFTDGAFIHVPAGYTVEEPVHLVFLSTAKHSGATSHPRNLILAEAGSRLTVTEHYASLGSHAAVTNAVTELVAGDHAIVEHVKFQDEGREAFHLATIHGVFGRASTVRMHSFALGARLSRNTIRTELAGEGLECILNGLYLTRGEQLADHHMVVDHVQPHCASHEYFNGILDDRSKGVFHGRIHVHAAAQKTDAKQTNKNILLSDEATADTKPQLEIYADDVKCTHGATIGQLDEDSIFYLRARGIGLDTARQMLIHAFAGEIIERVQCDPVRDELDRLIWDRLEQNPHIAERH